MGATRRVLEEAGHQLIEDILITTLAGAGSSASIPSGMKPRTLIAARSLIHHALVPVLRPLVFVLTLPRQTVTSPRMALSGSQSLTECRGVGLPPPNPVAEARFDRSRGLTRAGKVAAGSGSLEFIDWGSTRGPRRRQRGGESISAAVIWICISSHRRDWLLHISLERYMSWE